MMVRFTRFRAALIATTALVATAPLAQDGTGFLISIDGAPVAGDSAIETRVQRPDAQLAEADLRIQYDGLSVAKRLDLEILGGTPGPEVTLQSALNYPAFVDRGEIRLYDASGPGAPRLVGTYPIAPNGTVTVPRPEGQVYATHRVYDARGRYDETAPLSLMTADSRRRADGVEEGADATARQAIPVHGGAVTVSGDTIAPGATVTTLGERITPDAGGRFVLQRILPPGNHPVRVAVDGAGAPVDLMRDITVPASDWFHVATADLTFGITDSDVDGRDTYTDGRLAGYLTGRYANGVELTAQVDTGEGPLEDIFRDLDERDPRSVLLRVDPDDLYPTYGDDSTLRDDTPTSGRFYLRVERDGDYLVWGDYTADVQGGYLRNERSLYGLSAHWDSTRQTASGEARFALDLYAAQPDRLPQRDVLGATGGSVYFLNRQDIGIGSETVTVQVRDASTGRVLETRSLVAGQDYAINYIQGLVTLAAPLSGATGAGGVVVTDPGGATEVALVVQYEYSPDAGDLDTMAFGGRAEAWVTDDLRVGVTAMTEDTATGDQRAAGVDLMWQPGANTWLSLDYARSDGPGFASSVSADGGLVFDAQPGAGGDGDAWRLDVQADLADLGLTLPGNVSAYYEDRTAGFSTYDYQVADDESLWGVALEVAPSDRLRIALYFDDFTSENGEHDREGGVELGYALTEALTLDLGLEHLDRNDGTEDGTRTDAALHLTWAAGDDATLYGYVQTTLDRAGTLEDNDRAGIGGAYALAGGWRIEGEVSDGDQGTGARLLFRQEKGAGETTYFGYERDPDRDLDGIGLSGTDQGRFVMGGTRALGANLSAFGENTYDLFGDHRALTAAYGASYEASDDLSFTGAMEIAQVEDDVNGDFERTALSFGVSYQDAALSAAGRIEYRREDGTLSGSDRDSETLLLVADLAYRIDDDRRILMSVDAATTEGQGSIVETGDLVDFRLGYALRPVDNERLNLLFRYRYLDDTYGQQLAGDDEPGALQRSHVLSAEASYDLNTQWTLGGKLGFRLSETAEDAASAWVDNDAWLGVVNARWHFVHNWDALVEVRALSLDDGDTTELGALGAVYRQLGPNVSLGVGYTFGTVSSDLTDIEYDEQGAFLNLVAQF